MHSLHNDSRFNNFCNDTIPPKSSPQNATVCIETAANGYVSMISSCKPEAKEIIKKYCENTYPINSSLWINVPVNSNGNTYKNIFCMLCQEENLTSSDWKLWELGFSCVKNNTGHPSNIQEKPVDYSEMQPYNTGYWTYTHAHEKLICYLHPKIADNSSYPKCCKDNCTNHEIPSHGDNSNVIANFSIIPKNQSCHNQPTPMKFNIHVGLQREMMPPIPNCTEIEEIYRGINCSQYENHSWPKTKQCLYGHNIDIDTGLKDGTIKFQDKNQTLVSKSLHSRFMNNDWFYINETSVHLCQAGHEINEPSNLR